jgi:chromosome segregation ATPase
MRVVFALAVLVVAASGVSLEQSTSRVEQAARSSGLGQNVLAELQAKMDAGTPIAELKAIINDIRTRLTESQSADEAQDAAHQAQCASDVAELDAEIARLLASIDSLRNQESQTLAAIASTESQITAKKSQIETDKADIKATEERIVEADRQRESDKQLYNNRTEDTRECQKAVAEILSLEGLSQLEAGQGDEAHLYSGALLEKVAAKTRDETARSLVQLAAVAVSALGADDVTSLKNLLYQLRSELTAYQQELDDAEVKSQQDHAALIAAENAMLDSQRNTLQQHEDDLNRLSARLSKEHDHLGLVRQEIQASQIDLSTSQKVKADTEAKCAEQHNAHLKRSDERREEQDTLSKIEAIIEEKLGSSLAGHVEDRINNAESLN